MKRPIVLNLFAGPGTGKSTTAADVFARCKWAGINCEMALEYAKDKVWEESTKILDNQLYVFGKQYHRIKRLTDQVDLIITDSPLLLSLVYYKGDNPHFSKMVLEEFSRMNNLNFFLQRSKKYNPSGRLQTEVKARELDTKIKNVLIENGVPFEVVAGQVESVNYIASIAIAEVQGSIWDRV